MLSVAASASKEGTHLQDVIVPPHPHLAFTQLSSPILWRANLAVSLRGIHVKQ